ncbi:MAG: hypothetical protein WBA46_12130 [Thermomicrobiales bacterium]
MTPTAHDQLRRLQRVLYSLSILVFLASIVELLAAKHYDELVQLIPFAIAILGIVTVIVAWRTPSVWMSRWMNGFMLASAGASLLGMYLHVSGNMEFVRELRPNASLVTAFRQGFTGRDPILAPGVLAMGAFLAMIASSLQPATARRTVEREASASTVREMSVR